MEQQAVTAYIGLGSNLGDSKATLQRSWKVLGEVEGIILHGLSSPYMTAPVDMSSNHWFTNAVGRLKVVLSPFDLLKTLLQVEEAFGRVREGGSFGYRDRSLDLDLLYYGGVTMDNPELVLPHPHIVDRLFVLVPLAELEPDFIDPVSGKTITTMEQRLRESLSGKKIKEQEIFKGAWDEA